MKNASVIKRTYTLHLAEDDSFYRPAVNTINSVCDEFVRDCGVRARGIKFHVSSIRPGKKGWRKVVFTDGKVKVNKHTYTLLDWQRNLFYEASQSYGWVKVEAISSVTAKVASIPVAPVVPEKSKRTSKSKVIAEAKAQRPSKS
jgi:hypothetical protein